MVNTDDFIKRLEKILDYYNLNASSFADKIGVQRSSLSHLLSGRNKPSLDFILKINDIFPEVDLYWILNGKGNFPKIESSNENVQSPILNSDSPTPINLFPKIEAPIEMEKNVNKTNSKQLPSNVNFEISDEIEKIVFFYKNGTFKIFNPNSI
ncbi:Cro/C1-type helix-turn-helix domain [Flavobacteriaceae bacterium]